MKKALFAISSLGLGHATRTLAILRHFLPRYEITVLSYGKALAFLRQELLDENVTFLEVEDYPNLERGEGVSFYYYLLTDLIRTNVRIHREHIVTAEREGEYDFIFSDGRYGVYSQTVPSFLLSHQISFMPPRGLAVFKFLADFANGHYFKHFSTVFIPDYEPYQNSLAGNLSHPSWIGRFSHEYIGVVSSYEAMDIEEDIDYLFVISGYLEATKESFVARLLAQAKTLPGKKVFILGDPTRTEITHMQEENITLYPSATQQLRTTLFSRAKVVVSRTGYTTIMDLVECDKRAILFPTPRSTEQEYLAAFHQHRGYFVIGEPDRLDLDRLSEALPSTQPLAPRDRTAAALAQIDRSIMSHLEPYFFTLVVPVHNEEAYLPETVEALAHLRYDSDRYEIILVENGSTDASYTIAKTYEETMTSLKVHQSERGVSTARNLGLSHADARSDFTIFLDADTHIGPHFLKELNTYLRKHAGQNPVIGTCAVAPWKSDTWYDRLWCKLFDIGHKVTRTSCAIQIAKTSVARLVTYDETLHYSEDLKFIKSMRVFGNFFFVDTNQVATSMRRFQREGYLKTLLHWIWQANTPEAMKRDKSYRAVR